MTKISGSAAAVTGAASGIGRALALRLADLGCDLALADRDETGLASLAGIINAKSKVKCTTYKLDVSNAADVARFAAAAIAAHPGLNIVVNNAGVALLGDHDDIKLADFEWVMSINFWGVVYGCQSFLPHLSRQREAHIVNLSSVFGFFGPPGQTAYASSKFAVRGYSEALRHECEERNWPVHVSLVHPGGIKTNIVRNARTTANLSNQKADLAGNFDTVARSTPEQAAQCIVDGILRNSPRILIGSDARLVDRLTRYLPVQHFKWLQRLNRRASGRTSRLGAKAGS